MGRSLRVIVLVLAAASARAGTLTGEVRDAASGRLVAARVYIQSASGDGLFPKSAAADGSAVRYDRRSGFNPEAIERHTTLSAHPFTIDLAAGAYTITVERGTEYRPLERRIEMGAGPLTVRLEIERWIDMASRGWYSGDTHVHRDPAELPNVQLAEDVNVALPMVYWTTADDVPPSRSPRNSEGEHPAAVVSIDATHAYYPRNTEYEIFTTAGRQHTLGALLIVGHRTVFDLPALPVSELAKRARAEGALLDLEKHNWPWSMAIAALLGVDLYELANNHHWRIEYSVKDWADRAPGWMGLEGSGSATERDWTHYGFLNYYALLDCGFRPRPTAGTANGVHPVPLGFSRVYVHLEGGFDYGAWMAGLDAGRSFVTTGPMLLCKVDGRLPARDPVPLAGAPRKSVVEGAAIGERAVRSVEIVVNGVVARRLAPEPKRDDRGAFVSEFREEIELGGSSWIAVRAWEERDGGRFRFAHTAPWHFEVPGRPLRPRREEARFLADRVRGEIERSGALLPPGAVEEFRRTLSSLEALEASSREE